VEEPARRPHPRYCRNTPAKTLFRKRSQGLSRRSVKVDNSYDFASFLSFALAEERKGGTIERVLAKSDIELALEVLSAELVDQLTGRQIGNS
jgi:hypothetical protein